MHTCQKLERSRGAKLDTLSNIQSWLKYLTDHETIIRSYYSPYIFDGEHYRDWFTGM